MVAPGEKKWTFVYVTMNLRFGAVPSVSYWMVPPLSVFMSVLPTKMALLMRADAAAPELGMICVANVPAPELSNEMYPFVEMNTLVYAVPKNENGNPIGAIVVTSSPGGSVVAVGDTATAA